MSKIALIINKSCNICKFSDVDENFISLVCLKYDSKVEDKFVCQEFEVSKDSCIDCIDKEDILEYKEVE